MKTKYSEIIFTIIAAIIISILIFFNTTLALITVITYFTFDVSKKWKHLRGEIYNQNEEILLQQDNIISVGTRIVKKGNLGFLHLDQYLRSIETQVSRLILEILKKASEEGGDDYAKKMLKIALSFEQDKDQGIENLKREVFESIEALEQRKIDMKDCKSAIIKFFSTT